MQRKTKFFLLAVVLVGCTSTVVQYPSVCPNDDKTCQRNLNAQTLSIIGQKEAAAKLMAQDPSVSPFISASSSPCGG